MNDFVPRTTSLIRAMHVNFTLFQVNCYILKMIPTIFLSSADQTLGRLDPALMSTQACMEVFIGGTKNKSQFTDDHGNFRDIEE